MALRFPLSLGPSSCSLRLLIHSLLCLSGFVFLLDDPCRWACPKPAFLHDQLEELWSLASSTLVLILTLVWGVLLCSLVPSDPRVSSVVPSQWGLFWFPVSSLFTRLGKIPEIQDCRHAVPGLWLPDLSSGSWLARFSFPSPRTKKMRKNLVLVISAHKAD